MAYTKKATEQAQTHAVRAKTGLSCWDAFEEIGTFLCLGSTLVKIFLLFTRKPREYQTFIIDRSLCFPSSPALHFSPFDHLV